MSGIVHVYRCLQSIRHTRIEDKTARLTQQKGSHARRVQARYLDAVRLHGRDPKLIAKAMGNRTIGACKKFWSKVGQNQPFQQCSKFCLACQLIGQTLKTLSERVHGQRAFRGISVQLQAV